MANIAYVRVSTMTQNKDRQIKALEQHCIDKWFIEEISAKDNNRPELNAMLDYAREEDVIYIHDLSRLARNTKDLLNIITELENRKIKLVSNKENIDTSTPTGKLMLTMIGAIAEFERENLLERQREGIAIAKAKGKYKGRKAIQIERFNEYYERYMHREINKSQLAKELNISRPTLNKLILEHEKNKNI